MNQYQKGVIAPYLIIPLVGLGILIYLLIGSFAPLKDRLLSTLFPKPSSMAAEVLREEQKNKTFDLFKLAGRYAGEASPINQRHISDQMITLAKQRKQAVLNLIEQDPAFVLKTALSSELRSKLPSPLQNEAEEVTTLEGNLLVVHTDDFQKKAAQNFYYLDSGGQRISLYFAGKSPALKSGTTVKVTGIRLDNKMAVSSAEGTDFQIPTPESRVLGTATTKKVAVFLIKFQNDASQPYTADDLRAQIFTNSNSANAFYNEASFGKLTLEGKLRVDGDIYGPYTIASNNNPCDDYNWAQAAESQAKSRGVDLSGYTNYIYVRPAPGCNMAAGEIGGGKVWVGSGWSVNQLSRVVAHELGHNFGAGHANSYVCLDASNQKVSISSNCTSNEYGDPFDVMGGGDGGYQHDSAFHKGLYNWLDPANTQTVTTSGTYTLSPLETSSTAVQSLRIPRNTDSSGNIYDYYYLDYRQPGAIFDQFVGDYQTVLKGISIRIAPPYNVMRNSFLIDTTPGSDKSFADASLLPGKIFQDTVSGISITTNSVSTTNASVKVAFGSGTCSLANPTLSLSPSGQWGNPAQTLTYNLTLTNSDSSACSPAAFNISSSAVPTGFSVNANPTSVTLSPAGAASISVSVTSPAGAASGYYSFAVNAANSTASTYSASTTGSYNINSTSTPTLTPAPPSTQDKVPPTVSLTSPTASTRIRRGSIVSIRARASDNINVAQVEIYVNNSLLCRDTTAPYSCSWKVPIIAGSSYNLKATAYDRANNSASSSVTVSVR